MEISAAEIARTRVLRTAPSVSASRNSSRYQYSEPPDMTLRLLDALKEKTSRMTIGANRKIRISAVNILELVFIYATAFLLAYRCISAMHTRSTIIRINAIAAAKCRLLATYWPSMASPIR